MVSETDYERWNDWRWQIESSLCGEEGLKEMLGREVPASLMDVIQRYPFRVTPYYRSVVEKSGCDALLSQVLPHENELLADTREHSDPFDEKTSMPVPGLIRRYKDRVVLIASSVCAAYCRHCTRKNVIFESASSEVSDYSAVFSYLESEPDIREVIVSGGDPLLKSDSELKVILDGLAGISTIESIRIGTRTPVVLPMRITAELAELLGSYGKVWLNTQFNHPAELTAASIDACRMLVRKGVPVSNQTVLLKDVNDESTILIELCRQLQSNLVRPYYVFLCDPVAGLSHMRTSIERAVELEEAVESALGGLAVPRFVADLPGASGKTPLRRLMKK